MKNSVTTEITEMVLLEVEEGGHGKHYFKSIDSLTLTRNIGLTFDRDYRVFTLSRIYVKVLEFFRSLYWINHKLQEITGRRNNR